MGAARKLDVSVPISIPIGVRGSKDRCSPVLIRENKDLTEKRVMRPLGEAAIAMGISWQQARKELRMGTIQGRRISDLGKSRMLVYWPSVLNWIKACGAVP